MLIQEIVLDIPKYIRAKSPIKAQVQRLVCLLTKPVIFSRTRKNVMLICKHMKSIEKRAQRTDPDAKSVTNVSPCRKT